MSQVTGEGHPIRDESSFLLDNEEGPAKPALKTGLLWWLIHVWRGPTPTPRSYCNVIAVSVSCAVQCKTREPKGKPREGTDHSGLNAGSMKL